MIVEAESGNAHIGNAVNGRSIRDNLPSVAGAGEPNTAVKNARKEPGVVIGSGASLPKITETEMLARVIDTTITDIIALTIPINKRAVFNVLSSWFRNGPCDRPMSVLLSEA